MLKGCTSTRWYAFPPPLFIHQNSESSKPEVHYDIIEEGLALTIAWTWIPLSNLLACPSISPTHLHRTITPLPKEGGGKAARSTLLTKLIAYQVLCALAYLHTHLEGSHIRYKQHFAHQKMMCQVYRFWHCRPTPSSTSPPTLFPEKEGHLYFGVATRYLHNLSCLNFRLTPRAAALATQSIWKLLKAMPNMPA